MITPARDHLPLHDVTMTASNHAQWIRRFDVLWSTRDSPRNRMEMQTLLHLIEQYEQYHQPDSQGEQA